MNYLFMWQIWCWNVVGSGLGHLESMIKPWKYGNMETWKYETMKTHQTIKPSNRRASGLSINSKCRCGGKAGKQVGTYIGNVRQMGGADGTDGTEMGQRWGTRDIDGTHGWDRDRWNKMGQMGDRWGR